MPVEIKELVIRATIREQERPGAVTPDNTTREKLVKECVEQVLDLLKREKER